MMLDDTGTTPARGLPRRDCRAAFGVHRKTVGRALKRGGPPSRGRRRERYAKLRPYMATVDKLLQAGVYNWPWSSTARSRPWDTTARFASCVPTSSPGAPSGPVGPPYASRPNPAVSCSMTGVRSSSLSLVVLRESTSLSASWATRAASTSWRRLAAMPSTPTRAWYGPSPGFGGVSWAGLGRQSQGRGDGARARRRAFQRTLQATGSPLRLRAQGLSSLPPENEG